MQCDDPVSAAHAARLLAGLAKQRGNDDAARLSLAPKVGAFAALIGTINVRAVAAAEGRLLLHSGGLARPDGQVAALCGPSGSGKSTLTALLARRGLAYVTDETLSLDPQTLQITPFRKPLSLKRGSWSLFPDLEPRALCDSERQWLVAPDDLRGAPLPPGLLTPQLVVFPTYVPGGRVQVERLTTAEAAYQCGGNSSRLQTVSGGGLPALARLSRRTPAYRLIHGDVHSAADAVEELWDDAA